MAIRDSRFTMGASQEAVAPGLLETDGTNASMRSAMRVAGTVSSVRAIDAALVLLVALALALRVYLAFHQPPFIDEAFSLLAIRAFGEHGLPLLPTGTPYLHGATLSYLLAPLTLFGWTEPENLISMRMVSAVAGATAVYLTFRLALMIGASGMTSLFAAALVAVDPASVVWGGYLRMYALAQAMALGVALVFMATILDPSGAETAATRRRLRLIALVVVFWLAIFTHLATALLWPAMALVAVLLYGKSLLRTRWDVTAALLACLGAPAMLIILNSVVGLGAGTKISEKAEGLPGISFLGDDKLQLNQLLHPDPAVWSSLFAPGPLENLMPLLVTLASGVLVAMLVVARTTHRWPSTLVRGLSTLLAVYWIPILLFAFLAGESATRYGLFLVPFGSISIAAALQFIATMDNAGVRPSKVRFPGSLVLSVVLAAVMLLHGVAGIAESFALAASGRRDLTPALRYVRAQRAPGETVITVIPPPMTAMVLGGSENLLFLPGGDRSLRTQRYTRLAADGRVVDYWLGVPTLTTKADVCAGLADSHGGWVVISKAHWERWGYSGGSSARISKRASEMQAVVTGSADLAFEDRQGRVYRVQAPDAWSEAAKTFCDRATKRAGRGSAALN